MNIREINEDDILKWADGSWCFRADLGHFPEKGDDFHVLPVGTDEWLTHWAAD